MAKAFIDVADGKVVSIWCIEQSLIDISYWPCISAHLSRLCCHFNKLRAGLSKGSTVSLFFEYGPIDDFGFVTLHSVIYDAI